MRGACNDFAGLACRGTFHAVRVAIRKTIARTAKAKGAAIAACRKLLKRSMDWGKNIWLLRLVMRRDWRAVTLGGSRHKRGKVFARAAKSIRKDCRLASHHNGYGSAGQAADHGRIGRAAELDLLQDGEFAFHHGLVRVISNSRDQTVRETFQLRQ
jgi:hypothetical protein